MSRDENMEDLRELLLRVLREHRYHDVDDDFDLCLICGRTFDENVASFGRDFRVFSVDDGRQGAHDTI